MMRQSVALMLALTPLAAFAQSETGTRLGGRPAQVPDRGTMSDAMRARVWLENYAECVAKRDIKRVARALDAPLSDKASLSASLRQGNFDSCLSGGGDADELRMNDTLLRGALYATRVRRDVRDLTPEMVAARPLAIDADGADPAHVARLRFGDCVMRQDPGKALDYVASRAATENETKTLNAIKPALGACIDSGQKVELSRPGIKSAIAEAIYRTMRAPVVAAKADGN